MRSSPQQPGHFLRDTLAKRGWTQMDLALIMDKPLPAINEIINGKRTITALMAIHLESALGIPAEDWLELEARYQLSKVESDDGQTARRAVAFKYAPVKDMQKRGWIPQFDSVKQLEVELCDFFRVSALDTPPPIFANARSSTEGDSFSPEQVAWCMRAAQLAELIQCKPFSSESLEAAVGELRALARTVSGSREVPSLLARAGIRFVVVEHLPRTKIDGAAFWLDRNRPVIAVSLRYDRIDAFWHTLMHEISHIRHRDAFSPDSDILSAEPQGLDLIEERANKEGAIALIADRELQSFVVRTRPFYKREKILGFANRIKIHPGIVTGQLQFRGEISYKSHRDFLEKVREHLLETSVCDGWGKFPALQPT